MDNFYYKKRLDNARKIYSENNIIRCPYFNKNITINSEGFHHLCFSNQRERKREEQLLKFSLLSLAFDVIKNSGTLQEYRKTMLVISNRYSKDKSKEMKEVEYWGLVAIISDPAIKIKVILRKVGNGNIHFWSVMPQGKRNKDTNYKKLYTTLMEDD